RSGPNRGPALGGLVDLDEVDVVLGDLACAGRALDLAVDVRLQRIPPDRATDGEAHETGHRRRLCEPVVDLGRVGTAPEHHAGHAVATVRARLRHEHLAVRALVHSLDLPYVHLDPGRLDLQIGRAHV